MKSSWCRASHKNGAIVNNLSGNFVGGSHLGMAMILIFYTALKEWKAISFKIKIYITCEIPVKEKQNGKTASPFLCLLYYTMKFMISYKERGNNIRH